MIRLVKLARESTELGKPMDVSYAAMTKVLKCDLRILLVRSFSLLLVTISSFPRQLLL